VPLGVGSAPAAVPVEQIRHNAFQPRRAFAPESLAELTDSIRAHGILQPLLVRAVAEGYELIAGERRLRAARDAGLREVPVIILQTEDVGALELALVENLQREDLNPVEEAEGYRALGQRFGLTQEQISERVGKARASVTNALRLLQLPEEARDLLASGQLSAGHGKLLTGLEIAEEQLILARRAVEEDLSVRQLEELIRKMRRAPRRPRAARNDLPTSHVSHLCDLLHARLGTHVRLRSCRTYANGKKGKGTLEIDFYSNEDLDRILDILGIGEEP
jgi:ParB family chromosome partitioning protein